MGRLLWGKWSDQGGGGRDGDAGGGNGPGNIGRQGMNVRAWVGGEGEQAGQGCAWGSFPTLHYYATMKMSCAATENERNLGE